MKRYLPILFGLMALILVNSNIFKQELLIKNGKVIFVELQPVDPRSLIQGDYMALRYKLHIDSNEDLKSDGMSEAAISLLDYRLIITLDDQSRLIGSTIKMPDKLSPNQHLLIVKKTSASALSEIFYPASNSYLFAEGLAYCYDKARYAELRVNESGRPLLYRLTDEKMEPLNCESKHRDTNENL